MTIKAGANVIRESTPEEDDAATTAAYRIGEIGRLLGMFKPGYRFMLDLDAIELEMERQIDFVKRAAHADRQGNRMEHHRAQASGLVPKDGS